MKGVKRGMTPMGRGLLYGHIQGQIVTHSKASDLDGATKIAKILWLPWPVSVAPWRAKDLFGT